MIRRMMFSYPVLLGSKPFIDDADSYTVVKYCMSLHAAPHGPGTLVPTLEEDLKPPQTIPHLHRATAVALLAEEMPCQASGIAAVTTVLPVRKHNYLHKEGKTHTASLEHRHGFTQVERNGKMHLTSLVSVGLTLCNPSVYKYIRGTKLFPHLIYIMDGM